VSAPRRLGFGFSELLTVVVLVAAFFFGGGGEGIGSGEDFLLRTFRVISSRSRRVSSRIKGFWLEGGMTRALLTVMRGVEVDNLGVRFLVCA
jgi:hypothetical protein